MLGIFTKLPPELRKQIYEFVLCDNVIHLTTVLKYVQHRRFDIPETLEPEDQAGSVVLVLPPKIEGVASSNRAPCPRQFSTTSVALLQTRLALYREAILLLHSGNTFSMSSPLILMCLHDYVLRPQRFFQIRHLNLYWLFDLIFVPSITLLV